MADDDVLLKIHATFENLALICSYNKTMVLKLTIWVQIICTALTAHPAAAIYISPSLNVIMNFLKDHVSRNSPYRSLFKVKVKHFLSQKKFHNVILLCN